MHNHIENLIVARRAVPYSTVKYTICLNLHCLSVYTPKPCYLRKYLKMVSWNTFPHSLTSRPPSRKAGPWRLFGLALCLFLLGRLRSVAVVDHHFSAKKITDLACICLCYAACSLVSDGRQQSEVLCCFCSFQICFLCSLFIIRCSVYIIKRRKNSYIDSYILFILRKACWSIY